jgi:hypothetical protein
MARIDLRKKVRIHEALAEALSAMNLRELDFETLFFLLAKISKSHTDETTYELNMKEFEALTGKQNNIANYTASYKRLRATTLEIATDKSILIDGIVSSAELIRGYGLVQVKISSKMKPYLLNLTQGYTEHQLYSIIRLKSKHSKRFYLYLSQHRPVKGAYRAELDYESIDDLKTRLGYGDGYETNGNFINKVLKVVKSEINELSNIRVSYSLKKRGRGYHWISWQIENKDNSEMIRLDPFSQKAIGGGDPLAAASELAFIERLKTHFGLSDHQAEKVARMLARPALLNSLAKVEEARKAGKIKSNIGGYTRSILLNDFGSDLKI